MNATEQAVVLKLAQSELDLKTAEIVMNAQRQIALAAFWTGDAPQINKARADVIDATEKWMDALQANTRAIKVQRGLA